MPDVAELADVEFRFAEMIEADQEPGIDAVRMLAQGHVSQIEQPLDLDVVRKLFEILRKMPDRQPRSFGMDMHGGG